MAYPKINIIFKSVASTVVKRGDKGIVLAILKDAAVTAATAFELTSAADIVTGWSTYNKAQLQLIFKGGTTAPRKVIAYLLPADALGITAGLTYAETVRFDYLVVPGATSTDATAAASAIKSMRSNLNKKVKAVLPHTPSDSEGIINLDTDDIVADDGTIYDATDFCSRIAGLIAGTPLSASITFTTLGDVKDVPRMSQAAAGTAIDAGKLILFHDGEKVKVARGVNSLTTTSSDKGDQFKKIKIVDILDLMHDDIKRTAEDNYIGKVSNTYANKCLLINAINAYFEGLEVDGLLEPKANKCYIDLAAQKAYLKSLGYNVDDMKDAEIKAANTRDQVFLAATVKPVDSVEEILFTIIL